MIRARMISFGALCAAAAWGQNASWQQACFDNPSAAFCKGRDFAVKRPAPTKDSSGVVKNTFASTGAPAPSSSSRTVTQPSSVGVMAAATPAKPMVKVADELASKIVAGATEAEVLDKLGEPHSKITGDFQKYTYFLESGKTLKLDLEDGRVTQVKTLAQ